MLCSRDDRRQNIASIFVGGFILGGIVVGTLGCIYAPQVLNASSQTEFCTFCKDDVFVKIKMS